jgi:RNA polymerase sigma-70 factor (ECF subfamily)
MNLYPRPSSEFGAPEDADMLQHASYVERLARTLAGNEEEARDLVQDVWLSALRSPPRNKDNLRGWFRTVMKRTAWGRARRRRSLPLNEEECVFEEATSRSSLRAQLLQDIAQAVDELSEPYQDTVRRRFVDGLSPQRIADERGCSVHTVNTQIRRGIGKLRERLDRKHGDRRSWSLVLLQVLRAPRLPAATKHLPGWSLGLWSGAALLFVVGVAVTLRFGVQPAQPDVHPTAVNDRSLEGGQSTRIGAPRTGTRAEADGTASPVAQGSHARLEVRVVDRDGEPVDAATVLRFEKGVPADELGTTAPDGIAVVELRHDQRLPHDHLAGRRMWVLGAVLSGRVATDIVYVGEDVSVVTLSIGGNEVTLTGIVRDDRGSPIAGARVLLTRNDRFPHQQAAHIWRQGRLHREFTDDAGRFVLSGLAPGRQELRVHAPGFVRAARTLREHSGTHTVDVDLKRGTIVQGRAMCAGAPLAGARVWSRAWNPSLNEQTLTSDEGWFRLEGLAPGTHELYLQSPLDEHHGSRHEIETGAGELLDWNPDCGVLAGNYARLISEDGAPLEGWSVKVDATAGRKRTRWLRTDSEGRFRLVPAVHPIEDAVVLVYGPVYGGFPVTEPTRLRPVGGRARETTIMVRTDAFCVLEGTVLGAPEKPFAFAEVRLRKDGIAGPRIGVDEATGGFRAERLPAGTYELTVWAECQVMSLGFHTVAPGDTRTLKPMTAELPGTLRVTWPDPKVRFKLTRVLAGRDVVVRETASPESVYALQPGPYRVEALQGRELLETRIVNIAPMGKSVYEAPALSAEGGR